MKRIFASLNAMKPKKPPAPRPPDLERIDDAVLALLWLTSFTEKVGGLAVTRAWKGHDWEALGRLHEKGLIGNPVGRTKSIVFTEEGRKRAGGLFEQVFGQGAPAASITKIRHPFAPSAERPWAGVPGGAREEILAKVWCGHCRECRQIEDFTGLPDAGDLILRGFCAECGHVVVRLLETSETSGTRPHA